MHRKINHIGIMESKILLKLIEDGDGFSLGALNYVFTHCSKLAFV